MITLGRTRAALPARGVLALVSMAVVGCVVAPLVVVIIDAHSAGWHEVHAVLFRRRSYELLTNTVGLTVLVGVGMAVVGTATAWCLERLALRWARAWTALLILPMAMPDFVVGFA